MYILDHKTKFNLRQISYELDFWYLYLYKINKLKIHNILEYNEI